MFKGNGKYKIAVLLGAVGYSSASIFAKLATAPSIVIVMYRTVLTLLVLLPAALRKRGELAALPPKDALLCFIAGACFACHFSLYCEAVKYTNVASATILVDCEVLFVAPIVMFFFHEKISKWGKLGILLTFIGGAIVIISGSGRIDGMMLYGNFLALASAFFAAVYTVIGKKVRESVSNTIYSFVVYVGASTFLLITAVLFGIPLLGYDPINYLMALCFTVFCTLCGHVVLSWALKYVSAPFVSTSKILEPFIASIFAFLIFGEVPALSVVIGGLASISGVLIYTTKE